MVVTVKREELLDSMVVKQLFLGETQYLECLRLGHETAFYPEALVSHLLATSVGVLLSLDFLTLFHKIAPNFL